MAMTNVAARLLTAKAAVFFWAAQGVQKIVIADATGGELIQGDDLSLLRQMNVQLEQISYNQNSEVVVAKGKGYAEGLLIQFALNNSQLIKSSDFLYKCTGKIYCRNFDSIRQMIESGCIKNIFWRHVYDGDLSKPWADMRFFYASKEFCKNVLIPAYLNSDDAVAAAEYYCFSALNEKLQLAKATRPLLSGFSGGTGKQYFDSSLGVIDLACPCWVGL